MLMHSRLKAAQHAGSEYYAQASTAMLWTRARLTRAVGSRKHGREAEAVAGGERGVAARPQACTSTARTRGVRSVLMKHSEVVAEAVRKGVRKFTPHLSDAPAHPKPSL